MHLLFKIHVAETRNKVFLPKIPNINMHNPGLSIVIISEFVLLSNRCINLYVDFLIVVLKLLINTKVSVHRIVYISMAANQNHVYPFFQ